MRRNSDITYNFLTHWISFNSLSSETNPPRQKSLAHVIRMGEIEHGITDQHHQLVMFATKCAGERLVLSLHNYAFPHPLPELFLRGPELFPVATNDQRRLLFLLLLFFLSHVLCSISLRLRIRTACGSGLVLHQTQLSL